ncbi:MAG: heavy-metal-associated domain-containing protein [Gammaproteobacteria bacterium]
MSFSIHVENIKCGGCANTIKTKLEADERVSAAQVDIEGGVVTLEADPSARDGLAEKLASLGYPEVGSVQGLGSAAAKAKSFVSCAVGRIDGGE